MEGRIWKLTSFDLPPNVDILPYKINSDNYTALIGKR